MDIIHSVVVLRERLQREPNNVFVPTMGHLHEGHIELIRIAKPRAACTVVSIFVNRLQFGPKEDFDRYPRTLGEDRDRLSAVGVDVVFAPDEKEIYPEPQTYVVEPSDLQHILEGAHRPGHFRGVATVVLKLFNLIRPHSAIFGKKDYQQYLVLRDMVRQLALPIEIIPADTVRAPDGLALSSRNTYLTRDDACEAPRSTSCCGKRRRSSWQARRTSSAWSSMRWRSSPDTVAARLCRDTPPVGSATAVEGDVSSVCSPPRPGPHALIDNVESCCGSGRSAVARLCRLRDNRRSIKESEVERADASFQCS